MLTKAIVMLFALLTMVGCNVCAEDKLAESTSPSARYVATLFRRGCGAASGFLYHVNLRESAGSFSSDYRGVNEDGQVFLTREGKITLRWTNEKTLLIDCDGCPKDRKLLTESAWKDVSITYQSH